MRKHKAAIKLQDVQGKKHPTDGLVWSLTWMHSFDKAAEPQKLTVIHNEKKDHVNHFLDDNFITLSPEQGQNQKGSYSDLYVYMFSLTTGQNKNYVSIFFCPVFSFQETFVSVEFTELHLHDYCQAGWRRLKDAL